MVKEFLEVLGPVYGWIIEKEEKKGTAIKINKDLDLKGLEKSGVPQTLLSAISMFMERITNFRKSEILDVYFAAQEGDHDGISLDVELFKEDVAFLKTFLPRSFLKVIFRVKAPSSKNVVTTLEKKLELSDMSAQSTLRHRICIIPTSKGLLWLKREDVSCSCDVILGWTDGDKIKANSDLFLQNLFTNEPSKDVVIVARNGIELKCHKIILEGQCSSDVLAEMVSDKGTKESRTGRIEMTEHSEKALSRFIGYLYGLELDSNGVPCDVAVELFKISGKYKMKELQEFLGKVLLTRGKDWFNPDDLLDLFLYVTNLDEFKSLKEHSMSIMLSVTPDLRSCKRFQELKRTDADAVKDLVWKLFDLDHKMITG